ncbi:hypothetical protein N752_06705 [Desulforamulus aquiferis]|nr:hypothetical protein [Desulforamulus aquiferis]RYD05929.1 hypothetical protein N752_06705 [Desulforamulus aquiferis]
MKKFVLVLACLFLIGLITGCGNVNQEPAAEVPYPEKIVIQAPPAPPTAPLLKMLENKPLVTKLL